VHQILIKNPKLPHVSAVLLLTSTVKGHLDQERQIFNIYIAAVCIWSAPFALNFVLTGKFLSNKYLNIENNKLFFSYLDRSHVVYHVFDTNN
jgi:hypothetical protein